MAVSVHWATGTVFCSPLSLLASNMGCIISKTKCSGFSKRNVSVRKHYILSIPVSDRSPKCLESDECWFAVGKRPSERGWENCTLSQKRPQNMHSERFFSMPKPSKILTIFRDPSRVKIGLFFRCFARLWCQFVVFWFSENGRDRFNFLWNTRVFDEKSSKSGRFDFKNIGLLKAKHPYFWGQTSVLLPKEVRCFRFFGRKTP